MNSLSVSESPLNWMKFFSLSLLNLKYIAFILNNKISTYMVLFTNKFYNKILH
jgi:hypothetical protein